MNQKPVLDKADSPKEERRCGLKYFLTGGKGIYAFSIYQLFTCCVMFR